MEEDNDSDDDENVENGRDGEGEQVVFKSLHRSRTKAAVAARVANRSATAELPDVQPAAAAGPPVAGPSNARPAAAGPSGARPARGLVGCCLRAKTSCNTS